MLIPPGMGKHKELNTSYIKFDQLLQDLSTNRFSGYVKVLFWGFEGLIVFDTGRMIQAFSSERTDYVTGEAAIPRILSKTAEPEGTTEIYQLTDETAISLGYAISAVPYHNNSLLRNQNVRHVFDFLGKNQISGFVDLQFNEKRGIGTIYLMEGVPVETIIMTGKGKIFSGAGIYKKIIGMENLVQSLEIFHVKEPNPIIRESAFIMPVVNQNYLNFWKDCFRYLSNLMENRIRRGNFYEIISAARVELKNQFPFLSLDLGQVHIAEEGFAINTILHRDAFKDGMIALLRKVFENIPQRRLRKIDFVSVTKDINEIAVRNDLSRDQINSEMFVFNIFDGLI